MNNVAPTILTIGSINMDLVIQMERLPSPGETIYGKTFSMNGGGKGANQAVAVARLGGYSMMLGCLGQDSMGSELENTLKNYGVNTSFLERVEKVSTGTAVIHVDSSGENSITVVGGANLAFRPEHLEKHENLIAKAEAILLQLEIPLETVLCAVSVAKRNHIPVVLDPAPVPPNGFPKELFSVEILTPNEIEAEKLTGVAVSDAKSASAAAEKLLGFGVQTAIITLGEKGAFVASQQGVREYVPAFKVGVKDSTAAGDAFTAAMAVAFWGGMELVESVRFGCAAGALTSSRLGAQRAVPEFEEVKNLMKERND